ncbi:hypothetical protein U1Q18_000218, partial [Sarracenia purpurea var. burkii]
ATFRSKRHVRRFRPSVIWKQRWSRMRGSPTRSSLALVRGQGVVMAKGFCSNFFVHTNVVNLYATAERGAYFGSARLLLGKMLERNVVTRNSLLAGYVRNKCMSMALKVRCQGEMLSPGPQ